jgi:uncharacterized membrane protein YheB (UPF0754 family)
MHEELKAIAAKELAEVAKQLPQWIRTEAQRIVRHEVNRFLDDDQLIRQMVHETTGEWLKDEAKNFIKETADQTITKVTKQSIQRLVQREIEAQWTEHAKRHAATIARDVVADAAKTIFLKESLDCRA